MTRKTYGFMMAAVLISGCSSLDMQGHDPQEYYAKHPVENKVETRTAEHMAHFAPGESRLARDDIQALKAAMDDISPSAADTVEIELASSQAKNSARREHLSRLLRAMGYDGKTILFTPSETLARDDVRLKISYAAVVPPRCPDWRKSPVTNYSNTPHGGFGCAFHTNLGAMVADPRDLVESDSRPSPDAERNALVIQEYRSNVAPPAAADAGGASSPAQ